MPKRARTVARWLARLPPLVSGQLGDEPDEPMLPMRWVLRRIWRLLAEHRRMLALVALVTVANAALAMVSPVLARLLFDRALFPHHGPRLGLLYLLLAAMAGSILLSSVLQIVLTYLNNAIGQRIVHDLRHRLYERLTRRSMRFFSGSRTGELQTRLLGDVTGIQPIVTSTWGLAAENALLALAACGTMFVMSWPLALVSVLLLIPLPLLARQTARWRRRLAGRIRRSSIELNVIAEQTLSVSGALLTKSFGQQRSQLDRFGRESARVARLTLLAEVLGQGLSAAMQSLNRLASFAMYLLAGLMLSHGNRGITVGTLVAFVALQTRLLTALQTLADTGIQLTGSAVYFERIFESLEDDDGDIRDRPGALTLSPADVAGSVTFEDVWFSYQADERQPLDRDQLERTRPWALRQLSLSIPPRQMAAIVGASGAGKTTFSYLAARLYDATRGTIRIDDQDVRDLRLDSLANLIGMVTQETYVLNTTVRENLLYARPDATEEQLIRAAVAALLHERIIELPDGYDSLLGDRGYRFSGGERQRLAIARVFLKDAPILILDEATSSLDSRSERLIQQTLSRVAEGRTTIVIAHRLSTVMAADVIFVLDRGVLVEQGTHAELLARGGFYADLYSYQFTDSPARNV